MSRERQRLWTGIALISGPALFFVDNLIHPTELGRGNAAEQLDAIASTAERWQVAHLIGFVALIVIVGALIGLAFFVARDRPALALVGGALGVAGSLALAFAFALDGFTWGTLGELSNRAELDDATLAAALEQVQESGWTLPYYALTVAWVAGIIVLARGAAPRIGVRAAVLLGVGALLVGIEGVIADNAYFIASSGIFLIGGIDAGIAIIRERSSDDSVPV
ncbi:MAG: hypothetical protein ACR2OC_06335 [Solirubrobacterales bacterium]